MAFFGTIGTSDHGPALRSERLYLRAPAIADYPSWSTLRGQSRDFLTPWEPSWPDGDLSRTSFRQRLRRYQRDLRADSSYTFFIFHAESDALLGGVTLSSLRRGVTQSCALGYWIGEPYARQGFMSEAVGAIVPFVYDDLRLHRIEAACLPNNLASIRLLEKAGFTREGYARGYLRIAGKWQDHILFARLAGDTAASVSAGANIPHLQSVTKQRL
jgi:[ribosomal protein S5]-alanine N-acetyltransferase